jgi:hypothetical protein
MYDVVKVNLPYVVVVGEKTIQPGDYMIKELPSQSKTGVLTFYGDNGMKFETSAMTIPTYDPQTLEKSEVTLHHIGNDYYFDKMWVQGKNYGYEIPLPRAVKEREKEESASVPATYQPTSTQETTVTTAQNTPVPPPETASEPVSAPPVEPAPAPASAQTEIAQNTTPTNPEATPEANEANREELPHTSAGWLIMLLSGGTLSGAGLMLRRRS